MAKEFKYLKRERRPYMAPSRSVCVCTLLSAIWKLVFLVFLWWIMFSCLEREIVVKRYILMKTWSCSTGHVFPILIYLHSKPYGNQWGPSHDSTLPARTPFLYSFRDRAIFFSLLAPTQKRDSIIFLSLNKSFKWTENSESFRKISISCVLVRWPLSLMCDLEPIEIDRDRNVSQVLEVEAASLSISWSSICRWKLPAHAQPSYDILLLIFLFFSLFFFHFFLENLVEQIPRNGIVRE